MAPGGATAQDQGPCFVYTESTAADVLEAASVVVVGSVVASEPGRSATIEPELYLKGATLPLEITLEHNPELPCMPATLRANERLLLILGEQGGTLAWPGVNQVFTLREGNAYLADNAVPVDDEAGLVDAIRALTGQYSVPAGSASDSASLDWLGTVVPVTAAVLAVFGISLLLMKEWHRIDPT